MNYEPERDDYLNWNDDWNKRFEWIDDTYTTYQAYDRRHCWKKQNRFFFWRQPLLHRENDKPAIMTNSKLVWYVKGKLFRENDKPVIIYKNGSRIWEEFSNVPSRNYDRPAWIDQDGFKEWWIDGKQYYPEDSIIKSMKFDPKEKLIQKYIWCTPPNVLTPKIQQTIFELFPHLITEISFDFLIPEYQELVDYYE